MIETRRGRARRSRAAKPKGIPTVALVVGALVCVLIAVVFVWAMLRGGDTQAPALAEGKGALGGVRSQGAGSGLRGGKTEKGGDVASLEDSLDSPQVGQAARRKNAAVPSPERQQQTQILCNTLGRLLPSYHAVLAAPASVADWVKGARESWEDHCSSEGGSELRMRAPLCKSPTAVYANNECECVNGSDEPLRIDCTPPSFDIGVGLSQHDDNAVIRCPSAPSRGTLERAALAEAQDRRFGVGAPRGQQMRKLLLSGIIPTSLVGDSVCDCLECEDERDEALLQAVLG